MRKHMNTGRKASLVIGALACAAVLASAGVAPAADAGNSSPVDWAGVYGLGGGSTTDNNYSSNSLDSFEGSATLADGRVVAVGLLDLNKTDQTTARGTSDAVAVIYGTDGKLAKEVVFGGSLNEGFEQVIATKDGGFAVVGYSASVDGDLAGVIEKESPSKNDYDAIVCKFDAKGELTSAASYGGTEKDLFRDIVELDDGSFAVVGYSSFAKDESVGTGNTRDGVVLRYSADLKTATLIDTIGGNSTSFDEAKSIVKGIGGGFAVAGYECSDDRDFADIHHGASSKADGFIVTYDAAGKRTGISAFGGSGNDYVTDIDYDYRKADGSLSSTPVGYVLSGYGRSADGSFGGLADDNPSVDRAFLVRTDAAGKQIACSVFGAASEGEDAATTAESVISYAGGYLVAGSFQGTLSAADGPVSSATDTASDQYVAFADYDGETLASAHRLGGDGKDVSRSIDKGALGSFVLTGCTRSDSYEGIETYATGTADAGIASLKALGLLPSSLFKAYQSASSGIAALPAVGAVSVKDAAAVKKARVFYDSLPADLKGLLPAASLQKLVQVEAALAKAQAAAKKPAPAKTSATVNVKRVTAAAVAKALSRAGAARSKVATLVLGPKVRTVAAKALRGLPKLRTVVVRAKRLKSAKGALKSSKVATVRVSAYKGKAANKACAKRCAKLFSKKACGKKVKVKAA